MYFLTLLSTALLSAGVIAQSPPVPFTIDGNLESVSAKDGTFNTGGSITVSGITITIPSNLLVQFPAAFIPFKDFAAAGGDFGGWEVSVDGNYVDGRPVAGRVAISQLLGGVGAGIVESVGTDGTLKIVNGGPTIRINTPNGVYATAYTQRPFLTADESNPSICSFSGYPMCIPRSTSDADCPSSNRAANGDRVYTPKDPTVMAPFIAGDYVTWAGVKNGGEILAYTLIAENVQQLTAASKGEPVYVRVEDIIIGISDGDPNTEVGQTKFTGYLSDGTNSVTVYRIDVDPCTGQETETQVAAGSLKAGDVRNKFDIRFKETTVARAAREYRVKASSGQKPVAKNITAGQYQAPVSEMIWPENNVPGTAFSQLAFQLLGQLKDGFVQDNKQWGQLNPWPGSPIPTPAKTCTGNELGNNNNNNNNNNPPPTSGALPVADAGTDILKQNFGSITTLSGQNTNTALTASQVTFAWTGPDGLTLTNADKAQASFVNPWGTTSIKRTFTLKVCLASDTTKCATDTVDVTTDTAQESLKITSYQYANKNGGTITVKAETNNVLATADGAKLQLTFGSTTVAMVQDTTNGGLYTFTRTNIGKQPASISVKAAHNATPVTQTALLRRSRRGLRQ